MTYFCGFNGFGQFPCKDTKVQKPTELKFGYFDGKPFEIFSISWSFNVYGFENEILFSGFLDGQSNQLKRITMNAKVSKICSNDNICLILLENNTLHKYDLRKNVLDEIKLTKIENLSKKRSIFGEIRDSHECTENNIEHISCGTSMFIVITKSNEVFNLPIKIYQFAKHIKVEKLICGFEHSLVLTRNGDIYSWGNGMRGQLGHIEMEIQETPKLIEALAGIKMIYISAGGWHSTSISTFGDLYVWGSNVNGQLGLRIIKTINLNSEKEMIRKNPTVFPLPQIIDLPLCCCSRTNDENMSTDCMAVKSFTGSRHTFVQMSCGKLYTTGWNYYRQLGINLQNIQDTFIEFTIDKIIIKNILCGPWNTIFIS